MSAENSKGRGGMDLIVKKANLASWNGRELRCAVGRGGIVDAALKKEGDGATPAGRWAMREILYRSDRLPFFKTALPHRALTPKDGWCERPEDPNYNRLVHYPYSTEVDRLWRDDHLYDLIIVLGYNDNPVVAGAGSAIFLHLARPDFSPSAGCVTLSRDDLLGVVAEADMTSFVEVRLR